VAITFFTFYNIDKEINHIFTNILTTTAAAAVVVHRVRGSRIILYCHRAIIYINKSRLKRP
jgi:hypothetical protein